MVRLLMVSVLLAACAVEPTRDIEVLPILPGDSLISVRELETVNYVDAIDQGPDVCALAAQLPPDDLCSLICDPAALKQTLLDAGVTTGRCYLLLCALPEDVDVSVGVCLM
jgi:hypothetical protein